MTGILIKRGKCEHRENSHVVTAEAATSQGAKECWQPLGAGRGKEDPPWRLQGCGSAHVWIPEYVCFCCLEPSLLEVICSSNHRKLTQLYLGHFLAAHPPETLVL